MESLYLATRLMMVDLPGPSLDAASRADYLLVVSVGRDSLSPQETHLLKHAFNLGKRAAHIALWNPYHILSLDKPAFVTYGFRSPTLKALVKVLGGAPARGRLPFAPPQNIAHG